MGKVIAVCTSERKGIQKTSVPEIKVIEDWGIEGDAHAGKWHRQVSLLSFDKIEDFAPEVQREKTGHSERTWWCRESTLPHFRSVRNSSAMM